MHKELQRIRHGYYDLWFGTNAVYERWAKSHGLNNNLLLTLYLLTLSFNRKRKSVMTLRQHCCPG